MRDFQELLSYFPEAKKQGSEYIATCPACGKEKHLYISQGTDGRALMECKKCHAKGDTIAAALGKPASFLFLENTSYIPPQQKIQKEQVYTEIWNRAKKDGEYLPFERQHTYKDASGTVKFIKAIYRKPGCAAKTARWFRPTAGGYLVGTGDEIVPLFNADILKQIPESSTIYIPEGEKDCNTLQTMGLTATTMPNGGAQTTWDASYSEILKNHNIVIITDNDSTGKKYGKTIANNLCGVSANVKVIPAESILPELPEGGDITDICETVGNEKAFQLLQDAVSKQKHSANDLLFQLGAFTMEDLTEADKQPPEFVVDGMIPVGLTFLSGAPKTRKSFLALQLAAALGTGADFLGHHTKQCSVLYFDLEGSKNRLSARTSSMGIELPQNVFILNSIDAKLSGDGNHNLTTLIRMIHKQHPEIKTVIIDTYSRARGTVKSNGNNAYDQDVQFLEPVQRMAQDEKIALLFVHHDRKGANLSGDSLERLSGTMGISGSADSVLTLVTHGKRFEGKADLEFNPRDAQGGQMELEFNSNTTKWERRDTEENSIANSAAAQFLIQNPPDAGTLGIFYSWENFAKQVLHTAETGNAYKIVKDELFQHRSELYMKYGIALQWPVKDHGKRGFRVFCSKCSECSDF